MQVRLAMQEDRTAAQFTGVTYKSGVQLTPDLIATSVRKCYRNAIEGSLKTACAAFF